MHQGTILAQGSPDEIRRYPLHVTANLLGAESVPGIRVRRPGERLGDQPGRGSRLPCSASRGSTLYGGWLTSSAMECPSTVGDGPSWFCLVGRNGAGKTTTIESGYGAPRAPARAGEVNVLWGPRR